MADGATITGMVVTTTGLTLFGVSTGLEPGVLIAGFAGAVWAQSYYPPTHWLKRIALTSMGSILAGYLAPSVAAVATSYEMVRNVSPAGTLQLPAAVIVGFLAHRVLGPALMRLARKKLEDGKP